ncbi:unnamed protein product [Effrenium voratum]|nr:unnamed protein product [Effrenium voratum]
MHRFDCGRCVQALWFLTGIFLACLLSWVLSRSECDGTCEATEEIWNSTCMRNATADTHAPTTSASFLVGVFAAAGSACGVLCIGLIAVVALHLRERQNSSSYSRLLQGALQHQKHCLASVPEKSRSWKSRRWQADVFSCRDMGKIACLNLDMVNIAGVGLTLYRNSMALFLVTAILCRIGYGLSMQVYAFVTADWCLGRISKSEGNEIWRSLAQERGLALLRLYMIILLLFLYHLHRQGTRRDEFDRLHAEMSDYAFLASGFPADATQSKILAYLQAAVSCWDDFDEDGEVCSKPEFVGVSIGYDYKNHERLIQHLVEEHLMDVAARLEAQDSSESGSETSGSEVPMPKSLAQQRSAALALADEDEGDEDEVVRVLESLENSGTAVIVCRYPCESLEVMEKLQKCMDRHPWDEKHSIKSMPASCEPPSMKWFNFSAQLFDTAFNGEFSFSGVSIDLSCSLRRQRLIAANALIVGAFLMMILFYYFLYKRVYADREHPEQVLTIIVTVSCALGNVLLNQLVWFASERVGFRLKAHSDAFVLTWYTIVVYTNMCFNFVVICWSSGKMPDDAVAAIQYESALSVRLVAFLRGSFISYAAWPLFYPFCWVRGLVQVLYLHLTRSPDLTFQRAKWLAERAAEPPEWYMQYDYAGIVVLKGTSFMCLFVFGAETWKVFSWDIVWACCIYFVNKYIYIALSKETYYTSRNLDTTAMKLLTVSTGVLGGCACHWGFRAGQPFLFVLAVSLCAVPFLWACDHIIESASARSALERVWYDGLPYEQVERMYPFNWFNVNPGHVLRILHGVEAPPADPSLRMHQQVVWLHGKGYLQPDLLLDYGEKEEHEDDTDGIDISTVAGLMEAEMHARGSARTLTAPRPTIPMGTRVEPAAGSSIASRVEPPPGPPPAVTMRTQRVEPGGGISNGNASQGVEPPRGPPPVVTMGQRPGPPPAITIVTQRIERPPTASTSLASPASPTSPTSLTSPTSPTSEP